MFCGKIPGCFADVLGGWSFLTKPFKGTNILKCNKKRWEDMFFFFFFGFIRGMVCF